MRCSLARTLTLQPPIMLFDEPFGAVDEITRERLNEETLRLFERPALRRAVHHPLDLRGGVPQHPGPRDVAAARSHRRRDRGAVRLPPRSRPALRPAFAAISAEVSHALRAGRHDR